MSDRKFVRDASAARTEGSPWKASPTRSFTPWPTVHAPDSGLDSTVLVVDPDGVSRRFVELALGASPQKRMRLSVEGVHDAVSAMELLRTTLVTLVISETNLPDMNGLRFLRLLQQESRTREIPFVFLSADARTATKVVALRAGVDDFLGKPCDPAELTARVEGLIVRQRRIREAARNRPYTLAGEFATLPFPDLVSILELSRRTGRLSIATKRAVAELFLVEGQIVHATLGNLMGPEAFYGVMREPNGLFEFNATQEASETVTITESTSALIMEGARLLDDRARNAAMVEEAPAFARLRYQGTPRLLPSGDDAPLPPLAPNSVIATQYEVAVADPFAMGELRLWTHDELEAWTRADGGRDRFHVHLVADVAAGGSALLGIAGQPSERLLVSALVAEAKSLGLTFFLRSERLLDVVLIDARHPIAIRRSLGRSPALTIVAPLGGDSLSLGTKATVELENLLHDTAPAAILVVGNTGLETTLRDMTRTLGFKGPVARMNGALGEGHTDLRALLRAGIRLWGSAAPGGSR